MPESDEERKGREKFVREREYNTDRPRRDFNSDRRDYNGVGGIKRAANRRDDEPSQKRNRFDAASDSFEPQFVRKDTSPAPVMLTFKKFLATQDETISDDEAISKYNEYKLEFKKQEIEKYFKEHKDEEWFRLEYHPEESKSMKEERAKFVKRRLEIFDEFMGKGLIDKTSLDFNNAAEIIKLMDAVVIKLEDGTDEDIETLKDEAIDDESVLELEKCSLKGSDTSINDKSSDPNKEVPESEIKPEATQNGHEGEATKDDVPESTENSENKTKKRKTQLHKTSSIFFRNIPVAAKFADLENICKQHPGFLRIGLTHPLPESPNLRRGWVTFRRDVNIKEIFWGLRNTKLLDTDLGVTVNRDLRRRVRTLNGIASHRSIVQNDIRLAAKVIAIYDHRAHLYMDDENTSSGPFKDIEDAIFKSKNPLLKGIVDYFVEEADIEEELLLSGQGGKSETETKCPLDVDKGLLKVLDRLILYLRFVHSVDFYNAGEYHAEDTMPNRMGLIHVRGKPSDGGFSEKADAGVPLISKSAIESYIAMFDERVSNSLLKTPIVNEEELEKFGKKDPEKAVEEFVNANCVELAKDKWLCPLSGKKFKGPEFILKHLQSKFQEKLDEIRDEAIYFNNYLLDPNRPHDPEPKSNQAQPPTPIAPQRVLVTASADEVRPTVETTEKFIPNYRHNWSGPDRFNSEGGRQYGRPHYGGGRGYNAGGGRGGDFGGGRGRYFEQPMNDRRMNDPRQPVTYRDLDAPEEIL